MTKKFHFKNLVYSVLHTYRSEMERGSPEVVQGAIAFAILAGLILDMAFHMAAGNTRLVNAMIIFCTVDLFALVLIWRKELKWSGRILSWSLLVFLTYLLWASDGISDTAMVALPGALAAAGLILRKREFFLFAIFTLVSIALVGLGEIHGFIRPLQAPSICYLDIIDLSAIITVTGLTVRFLTDGFKREISRSKNNSLEMRKQSDLLRESEERLRTLFEAANDAIFILSENQFVDCNMTAVRIFGCSAKGDIVGLAPWDFSPPNQPGGENSRSKALAIFGSAVKGLPQRFDWQHRRMDGTLLNADVSLNRLDLGKDVLVQAIVRDVTEQNRMKTRLRESEEYYRKVVETSPDAIVIVDSIGEITFACQKMYELLRIPAGQSILGASILSWVAVERRETVKNLIADFFAGKLTEYKGEYEQLRQDGTGFWCDTAASPLNDESGRVTGLLLVCRDISERKNDADALQESEERFSRLSHATSEGIVMSEDGFIIDLNEQFARLLGYERDEMIGVHVTQLVPPDSLALVVGNMKSGLEEPYEHLAKKKDGSIFPVEARAKSMPYHGKTVRMTAIRDISERKHADEVYRIQNTALQHAASAIVITDRTGTIIYSNAAFSSLTGYSADEALGKNPRILKSGEQPQEFYKDLWKTIDLGTVWKGELTNKRKDGSLYVEEMTIAPVLNDGREITHFVAVKNDVTSRKHLQDQQIHAQKMEAIGTLAGGIAHDFNNILGIILGHISLLNDAVDNPVVISTSVATISKAVQRGANLVRQILTFARKTDVSLQPVDLNSLITEVIRMLEGTFPKTIEVIHESADSLSNVAGDYTQLVQAILNLCINSRDAMEGSSGSKLASGKLTLTTSMVSGTKLQSRFNEAAQVDYVSIRISDTGAGFDSETKKKIFEPFFTTKSEGKGTGLGLAVVYGVVKAHHGVVDVESQPGKGTSFTLYFPASENKAESEKDDKNDMPVQRRGTGTILVIEDEPALREFLVEVLTENGYTAVAAADGAEGIEKFKEHISEIKLVLSDMGLPKMDGVKVFAALKALDPNIKMVLASGYLEPQFKSGLYDSGVKGFLPKPYGPAEVLAKLQEVLGVKE